MPKKIFTQELEGRRRRRRGRPRKRWKDEVERDVQVLGVRRWRELVGQIGKNGRTLFGRSKPTGGCSADGRRRIYVLHPTQCLSQRNKNKNNNIFYYKFLDFYIS